MFCVEDVVMRKEYGQGWGEKHEIYTSLRHQLIVLTQELHWNPWAVSYSYMFSGFVITSRKTWKLATEKIHLDLNNLTHFHNSCKDKLDHTVYWVQLKDVFWDTKNQPNPQY
jgi:hypothetical protein